MASFLNLSERQIQLGGFWTNTNCSKGTAADATAPDGFAATVTNNSGATNDCILTLGRFISASVGGKYSTGFWAKKGTSAALVAAGVAFYDASFTLIGSVSYGTSVTPVTTGWLAVVNRDVTAPAGTVWWTPTMKMIAMGNGLNQLVAGVRAFRTEAPWKLHNKTAEESAMWQGRRARGSLVQNPGVRDLCEMSVTARRAGANMSADVSAGCAYVQGTDIAGQGVYYCESDSTVNVPIADPPAAGTSRITSIFAQVVDSKHSSFAGPPTPDTWGFIAIDGTPTSGTPSAPASPASSLRLADVRVLSNTKAIIGWNITDKRPVLVTKGAQIYTLDGSNVLFQASCGPWVQCNQYGWAAGWAFIPFSAPFPNRTITVQVTDTGPWNNDGKIRIITLNTQRRDGFWVAVRYDTQPYRGWLLLQWSAIGV